MGARRSPDRPPRRADAPSDPLDEYTRKRDFAVTPEPPPGAAAAPGPAAAGRPIFMVHKHHARRLHYDLRLEIGGALASWAVPKGPSYDPKIKRLAVQTEDHPLAYATFEGRIPEGEYGAGDSLVWDRGTFETVPPGEASRQRAKGHLHLELAGEKLRGRWHLVRTGRPDGGKTQWLLFKAADETADPTSDVVTARPESVVSGRTIARGPERVFVRRAARPGPARLLEAVFPPMLATPVSTLPRDLAAFVVEPKYDGFRALSGLSNGRAAMWSRNRLDLAPRFPGVAEALARIVVGDAVLDGEIVALDARGVPRFERLHEARDGGAVLIAFDLLGLDGEDLRGRPLEARRELLESLLAHAPPTVRLAERLSPVGGDVLDAARGRGFEGVVLKRRGSPYVGGRSTAWLKLKLVRTQEVAVVGFTLLKGAPDAVGALLVGVAEEGRLRFAGRVGTGFSARDRTALRRELARDAVPTPAASGAPALRDAVWVAPRHVAEVGFAEWTADGMLRHPTFRGLRPDRAPGDCVREEAGPPPEPPGPVPVPSAPPASAPPALPSQTAPIVLTHADRVLYPKDGLTKRDVADYYARVAEPMLRALAGRPLALEHFSDGIDRPGWFEQTVRRPPPWMTLVDVPAGPGGPPVRRLVADRPEVLRWLAQHAVLTVHMWSARVTSLDTPDWVVFDLDPEETRGLEAVIEAALVLRGLFERLGLPSVPKTSGRRGLHVLVAIAPGHTHEEARAFARHVGTAVAVALPEVTVERTPAKRRGRLYLDCLQNGPGKTLVAPYSPRARDGAPVSAPLAWSEVTRRLDPSRFTIRTMPRRLEHAGDLFAPALAGRGRLPALR